MLNKSMEKNNRIIYNTDDGKTSISLVAKDGNAWINQLMSDKWLVENHS
jgi:hypothetical protein